MYLLFPAEGLSRTFFLTEQTVILARFQIAIDTDPSGINGNTCDECNIAGRMVLDGVPLGETEVQWSRGAEVQGAEVQRCRGAEMQRCRGAEVHRQMCKGAQVHSCTGAQVDV